jgi:glutamate formiminotransferase
VNLEDVRRGAWNSARTNHTIPIAPDVGLPRYTNRRRDCVGRATFLIAFNVILRSDDIAVARKIARTIRARNGGLPFVKALGFRLHTRGLVQVSMNLS